MIEVSNPDLELAEAQRDYQSAERNLALRLDAWRQARNASHSVTATQEAIKLAQALDDFKLLEERFHHLCDEWMERHQPPADWPEGSEA